jgi:hypothetical protein
LRAGLAGVLRACRGAGYAASNSGCGRPIA